MTSGIIIRDTYTSSVSDKNPGKAVRLSDGKANINISPVAWQANRCWVPPDTTGFCNKKNVVQRHE